MSCTSDGTLWWVITESEAAHGPYESWEDAYMFATINLGMEGWTITHT